MSAAARMRKYRARKALRDALARAQRNGVDVAAVIEEYLRERGAAGGLKSEPARDRVTQIGVTGQGS